MAIIKSPSFMPVFSYGFLPSISVMPITKTPSEYSFSPIIFPSGTTFVALTVVTSTSFTFIKLNRLTVIDVCLVFPTIY